MHVLPARYGADAVAKLRELVAEAKGGRPLTPVTIVVRDNILWNVELCMDHFSAAHDGTD